MFVNMKFRCTGWLVGWLVDWLIDWLIYKVHRLCTVE